MLRKRIAPLNTSSMMRLKRGHVVRAASVITRQATRKLLKSRRPLMSNVITPKTHPDHAVVGHYFAGYSLIAGETQVYLCDSYDPAIGYWLTNIYKPGDRKNVSERAIGRTYHEAFKEEKDFHCVAWSKRYPATCTTHDHLWQKMTYGEGRGGFKACLRCGCEER